MGTIKELAGAYVERLAILMEECAEVQHIGCKILRHGTDSFHPKDQNKTPNRNLMIKELGDLLAAINLYVDGLSGEDKQTILHRSKTKPVERNLYIHYTENKQL